MSELVHAYVVVVQARVAYLLHFTSCAVSHQNPGALRIFLDPETSRSSVALEVPK